MAPSSKKIVITLVFLFLVHGPWSTVPLQASSNFVYRKWVVKLKGNSWMNKLPFQFAKPLVDGENIYVGVNRGLFYAVQAKRGRKIWTFKTQGAVQAKPAVGERMVFVPDTKGNIYALSKDKGELLWASKLDGEILSAPLVHENKLYVVTLSKTLSALDLGTGNILWQTSFGTRESGFTVRGSADPVLVGHSLLVGFSDGNLVSFDLAGGHVRWSKQLGDRSQDFHDVDATVLVVGKLAYVSSADGKLFALNPDTGQIAWQVPFGGVNTVLLKESHLYVTARGIVYCVDANSGTTLWEQDLEVPEVSSPAVYDKWLGVVATRGKIYFLDRQTGDVGRSWFVKGGSYSDPVISENQLFLLANSGRLYSFQFR